MSTDLFSFFSITVTYSVKLQNYYLIDRWGYLLCKFITSEYFIWNGLNVSVVRLCFITLERYVKIVHSPIHRKYYRKWMITAAVVICWEVGVISNTPLVYLTSAVVGGQRIAVAFFPSAASMIGYGSHICSCCSSNL